MEQQRKTSMEAPSNVVPQWKLDFLAKKQALKDHNRKLEERALGQNRGYQLPARTRYSSSNTAGNRNPSNFGTTDNADETIVQQSSADKQTEAANNNLHSFDANRNTALNNKQSRALSNGVTKMESDPNDHSDGTEEDDSETDSDSDSSVEDKPSSGRTGGYSFVTGQKIAVITTDTNESSDENELNETESEAEGSTELKYKRGYVSKLLNHFSSISYQEPIVASSIPYSARHNMIHNSNKTAGPNETTTTISSSRKSSLSSDQTINLTSLQISKTADSVSPSSSISPVVAEPSFRKPLPVKPQADKSLPAKPSYRAPNEIILIEGNVDYDEAKSGTEEWKSPSPSLIDKSPDHTEMTSSRTSSARVSPRSPSSVTSPAEGETKVQIVRDRILQAKAVFESRGSSEKKKSGREYGPPSSLKLGKALSSVSSPPSNVTGEAKTPSEVKLDSDQKDIVIITKDQVRATERQSPSVSEKIAPTTVKPPARKHRFTPPPTPSEPLFTSIKLKRTKHRLYDAEGEGRAQPEVIVTSRPDNRPTAAIDHKAKARDNSSPQAKNRLSPAGGNLVTHSVNSSYLVEQVAPSNEITAHNNLTNHGVSEQTSPSTQLSKRDVEPGQSVVSRPSLSDIPNKSSPTHDVSYQNEQTSMISSKTRSSPSDEMNSLPSQSPSSGSADIGSPNTNDIQEIRDIVTTITPTNHEAVKITESTHDPPEITMPQKNVESVVNKEKIINQSKNSTEAADKIKTEDIPPQTAQKTVSNNEPASKFSVNIQNTTRPAEVVTQKVADPKPLTSKQPPNTQLPTSTNQSASSNKVTNKSGSTLAASPVNGSQGNKAKSLADIPGPREKAPSSAKGSGGETDFQAALRRVKNKPASDELPVTNIDEIIGARKGSGTVLDTRKSMGKRKVPEYEKIHEGPTLKFTDTQVVIGNGCLRITTSTPMKKNLSFNDLEIAEVHEYPSEKVLIQQIPKEKDAVYWDDPDHLQAAADRSIDEPEPEATKSSLRASLTGTPTTLGTLANHRPSHQEEFKFGQKSVAPRLGSPPPQTGGVEDSDSLKIQPAADHELKSWSSDGTSDILF